MVPYNEHRARHNRLVVTYTTKNAGCRLPPFSGCNNVAGEDMMAMASRVEVLSTVRCE